MRAIAAAVLIAGLSALNPAWASGYADFNAGVAAKNRGEHEVAIAALSRALGEADLPQHLKPVAYYDRGEQELKQDRLDGAIADLGAAIALKPCMLDAWVMRGLAEDGAGRLAAAIADDGRAIALEPGELPAHVQHAAAYLEEGRLGEALADYSAMIAIEPGIAELHVRRANLYRYAGRDDAAVADADRALALAAGNVEAREARAFARAALGDAAALADASALAAQAPADPQALYDAGLVQWEAARYGEAQTSFARALALGASPYAALWLALAAARAGADAPPRAPGSADWPGPLLGLYSGRAGVEGVRAAAAQGDSRARRERECEADFYIGEWRLLHGAKAAPDLARAAALCPLSFAERDAAAAELRRGR